MEILINDTCHQTVNEHLQITLDKKDRLNSLFGSKELVTVSYA